MPQSRHRTTDAVPRRLRTRIARSPAAGVERRRGRPPARPRAGRGCRPRAPRAGRRRSRRARCRRRAPGGRPAGSGRPGRGPWSRPTGVARPEDDRGAGEPAELERGVAGLEPRRPVALVRGVVLLVDDDRARRPRAARAAPSASRRRGPTSPARIRRHSSARSPSPERRVEHGDPRRQVGAEPVDDRRGEGDLRDQQERRAAGREGRRDRLDVDRGLAAARHAVEEDRRRVATRRRRRARARAAAAWSAVSAAPRAARRGARPGGRRAAVAGARAPPRGRGRAGRGRRCADAPWRSASGAGREPVAVAPGRRRRVRGRRLAGRELERAPPAGAARAAGPGVRSPRRPASRPPRARRRVIHSRRS